MIYITGDIHGNPTRIVRFCEEMQLTDKDIVVLLGDVGANYYGGKKDRFVKRVLSSLPVTFLCVHGNHEIRPQNIPTYKTTLWNDGCVFVEDDYPNILFAEDGEIYNLDGKKALAIGGAYSVDKFYRLQRGFGWWADEQPSDIIKQKVESVMEDNKHIDLILSHTCPKKYVPTEMFLPMIDQSTVDHSTEEWLDTIEEKVLYSAWYCGHWHTDKRIDRLHFLFKTFETL
ncbi:MAG: metallophosphatase family protein [Clostridia bacterium]|nr:metallophosphatase family protein [Clostridia bacterium]